MENKNDDAIKQAITNPEETIQSLDKAKDAIKSLMDTKDSVEAMTQQNESDEQELNENSPEEFTVVIDNLLERLTGGYRYYDISPENKIEKEGSSDLYNITDYEGDEVAKNLSKDEVIDYAKGLLKYDDNEMHKEIVTFDDAKQELELHKLGKIINTNDTNQISLFTKKDSTSNDPDYSKVISKMDPIEVDNLIKMMGAKGWVIKKAIDVIKGGDTMVAYREIRRMLDMVKNINEEHFVNPEILSIIAESETPRLTKSDIISFISERKK
jgi:hypothetical protein